MTDFLVAALYKFVKLPDFADLRAPLLEACGTSGVMGTILLAAEGINGTIAGSQEGVGAVLDHIRGDPRLADLQHKESCAAEMPFLRMKVRLKSEIVTMGVPGLDPEQSAGTYVKPDDWNDLIGRDDVVVVDTRNDYEVSIGTFAGAVNPATSSFREFPQWVERTDVLKAKPKVAMFCTGGIRCEKSTAYLRSLGYQDVYHLEGGILKYLETVPEEESLWQGECFVFDQRVSVGPGLRPGSYDMCHACRQPIDDNDKTSPLFVPGVSCPACHASTDEDRKRRFADRQHQIDLAKARNEVHLGARSNVKSCPREG